jgi:hypothetical protein
MQNPVTQGNRILRLRLGPGFRGYGYKAVCSLDRTSLPVAVAANSSSNFTKNLRPSTQ